MSYVDSVLQPGERIIMRGHLHWIVYWQAILFFILNLIGLGLGPLAVGALSDVLNHVAGLGAGRGLQCALLLAPIGQAAAAMFYWRASRTIEADLQA